MKTSFSLPIAIVFMFLSACALTDSENTPVLTDINTLRPSATRSFNNLKIEAFAVNSHGLEDDELLIVLVGAKGLDINEVELQVNGMTSECNIPDNLPDALYCIGPVFPGGSTILLQVITNADVIWELETTMDYYFLD